MSAVESDYRANLHYDLRAIDAELNRWGKWIEAHSDYQGYPTANTLYTATQGRGGDRSGHRVLCLDMPVDVYAVHHRFLTLNERQREAVYVWFVIKTKEDGSLWTNFEKSERLGISCDEFKSMVRTAKLRIMGL